MNIIERHEPREYTSMAHDDGIVLCDKRQGAFLVLRFPEDVTRLIALLKDIESRALKS